MRVLPTALPYFVIVYVNSTRMGSSVSSCIELPVFVGSLCLIHAGVDCLWVRCHGFVGSLYCWLIQDDSEGKF